MFYELCLYVKYEGLCCVENLFVAFGHRTDKG